MTTHKLMKLPEVKAKTGLSKSSIYFMMDVGKFPQSIKISTRSVAWSEQEIDSWIEDRFKERQANHV